MRVLNGASIEANVVGNGDINNDKGKQKEE